MLIVVDKLVHPSINGNTTKLSQKGNQYPQDVIEAHYIDRAFDI